MTYKKEFYKNDPFYTKHPRVLDYVIEQMQENSVRDRLGWLFVEPRCAETSVQWGEEMLGVENKVSSEELARLFKWGVRGRLMCAT